MVPLLWVLIFYICLILFLTISVMIYFFTIYSSKNHKSLIYSPSSLNKWTWKW